MAVVPIRRRLRWALSRHCPRCGARGVFSSWLTLRERCPNCGLRFEREEGFFTGVYLVNYSFVAVAIVFELFLYLIYAVANEGDVGYWPAIAVGVVTAIGLPLITYPFAKGIWTAIDLSARPLDPVEEADAALHARHDTRG